MQSQDLTGVESDAKLKAKIEFQNRAAIYYIGMNATQYAPFKDKRVRQAFTMAVDRTKITEELLGGGCPAAKTIVPTGIPGQCDKVQGLTFNVPDSKN